MSKLDLYKPPSNRWSNIYCDETGIHKNNGLYMIHGALLVNGNDPTHLNKLNESLCAKYGVTELKGNSKIRFDKWEAIELLFGSLSDFPTIVAINMFEKRIIPYLNVLSAAYATSPEGQRPIWSETGIKLHTYIGQKPFIDLFEALCDKDERAYLCSYNTLVGLLLSRINEPWVIGFADALRGLNERMAAGANNAKIDRGAFVRKYSVFGMCLNTIAGLQGRHSFANSREVRVWHDEQRDYSVGFRHSQRGARMTFPDHNYYLMMGDFNFVKSHMYPEIQLIDMIIWSLQKSAHSDDKVSQNRLQQILGRSLKFSYFGFA